MGGGADCVIFELPELWVEPYGDVLCSFPTGAITCTSYPDAHIVVAYLNS